MMNDYKSSQKIVAIIGGTGREGRGLAAKLARNGYEVYIGSRSLEKAEITRKGFLSGMDIPVKIYAATYIDAVCCSEIILLTVPYKVHEEIIYFLKEYLQGKLLIDVTVPISPGQIDVVRIPPAGSAAQEAQSILGDGVDICTAFQNISHLNLSNDAAEVCDVLVTGSSEEARNKTLALVHDAGYTGWDAGPIENSIIVEGLTSVLLHINKKYQSSHAGIKITGV
jgi:hypothetical protein